MRKVVAALALLGSTAAAGIYPAGHFDVSTKLTTSNYKDVIQSTIDEGKTLMAFSQNPDVRFADVNLSEEKIREAADGTSFSPGAGGWPTIRYFNKETGVGGAPYNKKTKQAMCDELKQDEYMRAYIEEAAGTSLCSVATGAGCSDKQKDYASKWSLKPGPEVDAQKVRLEKMLADNPKLKPDVKQWIKQRIAVLKQLKTVAEEL